MTKGFCTNCGAKLSDEAGFCNNCGAKIEMVKGVPIAQPMKSEAQSVAVSEEQPKSAIQPVAPYHGYKPIRQRPKIMGYAFGIIFLIAAPFIVFAILGSLNLNLIGTLNFEVASFAETNVILDVDNGVGTIEIFYDSTITNLVEATLDVWGRPGSVLSDAVNFELTNDTVGQITVSFKSGERSIWYWDKTTFNYDIVIRIHPSAVVDHHIKAGTGSITFDTFTEDNLNISNVYLESGTGTIVFNMDSSVNCSLEGLYAQTGTGSLYLDFGILTKLNASDVQISTGTGTITFTYEDIIVNKDIIWNLNTGTGSIYLVIIQNQVLPIIYQTTIIAESGTGSINLALTLDSSIGAKITAQTGTGSINVFGSSNNYESSNYSTADNTFLIMLETGTGSITVS